MSKVWFCWLGCCCLGDDCDQTLVTKLASQLLNEPWESVPWGKERSFSHKGKRTWKMTSELMTMDVESDKDVALEAIKKTAVVISNDVIKSATNTFRELQKKEEAAKAKYKVKNIKWMACEDFTASRGVLQIEEYLKTWELHESWLHWTNYLNDEELKYSTRYHYRVCWSIPTCRKPIPRATASVYFIIELSKIKPRTLPVEVFFMVETNKLIHRPGESRFKEKWLKDVIESKICMMEMVNF